MSPADFPLHFLRPWWWLALLPLPLVLWMLVRGRAGAAALARLADAALLPHLLHDAGTRRRTVLVLVALAWLLGTAALAGPAWQRVAVPLYVNGAARVVALSLSNDMLAADLPPNRLTRARFAVRDLIDGAGDARTALVAYAGAAFTVAPLTSDKNTVFNLLHALQPDVMPVQGNDAAAGIEQGLKLLRDAHVRGGQIIVVTDQAGHAAVAAARKARAAGVRVDVLGVGTAQGAPVPRAGGGFATGHGGTLLARREDAALRAVAAAGGGTYRVLPPGGGPTPTFRAPLADAGHASDAQRARIWRDGGIWLLPVLLVLAALAFRRGWLLALAVLAVPVAMPAAHAATSSSWWANRNQRAEQALRADEPRRALELATSPALRGAAEYRAGDWAAAAKDFAKGDDARAHYNLGNALARAGKYPQAIAAYREALRQDPDFADARANLDAVKDWLKHHTSHASPSPQRGSSGQHGRSAQSNAGSSRTQGGAQRQSGGGAGSKQSSRSARQQGEGGQESGRAAPSGHGQAAGRNRQSESAVKGKQEGDEAARAARGLDEQLQRAERGQAHSKDAASGPFALGRNRAHPHDGLSAEQRALLQSVPDDPGALLRRKFELEWQQRHGQSSNGGS